MWQTVLEALETTSDDDANLFWPGIGKERENTMLQTLFSAAIEQGLLTQIQVERFLSHVMGIGLSDPILDSDSWRGLCSATRELLHVDEVLSPLSLTLFKKRLIPEEDRSLLEQHIFDSYAGPRRMFAGYPAMAS